MDVLASSITVCVFLTKARVSKGDDIPLRKREEIINYSDEEKKKGKRKNEWDRGK